MAETHSLPVEEPESDIVVALFIPLDPTYTRLVLGALRVLEDPAYFDLDPDGGNAGAIAAADVFNRRVITPLIQSLSEA
jgi:hypothetical protein